ncbi:MAG: DUF47 family protein [Xanthomonadales bacterium]|nr:DUF47 family protein [Xanthomonadales bacterium]
MLTFRKKEKRVAELVYEHIDKTEQCVRLAAKAVRKHLAGDSEAANQAAREVGHAEAQADELRREIGDLLFSGAYLPLVRSDIFRVVESVDEIANAAESCCRFFLNERVRIPSDYVDEVIHMMGESVQTFRELQKALKRYFKPKGSIDSIRDHVKKVGEMESLIDEHEQALTRRLFKSDLDMGHKVHVRQAIRRIVRISDRAEETADQVVLAGMRSIL